ncbi:MAG: tRNA (adenosine(37)-N6)-threonylcarbamoyltransferase complex dimerization subunit type 1 TsaB, partial [Candidimonas sp.]
MSSHFIALETSSSLCSVALLSCAGDDARCVVRAHEGVGEHAQRLLPMVDDLLREAAVSRHDVTAVAFGRGPGGFTGLRVACGVAQGMAFALDVPVLPVTSLLAVAQRDFWTLSEQAGAAEPRRAPRLFVAIQDARMGEVYLAAYEPVRDAGGVRWRERQEPILLDAAQVLDWLRQARDSWSDEWGEDARGRGFGRPAEREAVFARVCGDALHAYPSMLAGEEDAPWLERGTPAVPDARAVAYLARDAWEQGLAVPPDQASPLYVRDKVAYTTTERESGLGGNPKAAALPPAVEPMGDAHLDDVARLERDLQFAPWSERNFSDGLQAGYAGWIARRDGRI